MQAPRKVLLLAAFVAALLAGTASAAGAPRHACLPCALATAAQRRAWDAQAGLQRRCIAAQPPPLPCSLPSPSPAGPSSSARRLLGSASTQAAAQATASGEGASASALAQALASGSDGAAAVASAAAKAASSAATGSAADAAAQALSQVCGMLWAPWGAGLSLAAERSPVLPPSSDTSCPLASSPPTLHRPSPRRPSSPRRRRWAACRAPACRP